MARRKRNRDVEIAELAFALVILLALGIGGTKGFGQALSGLVSLALIIVVGGGVLVIVALAAVSLYRRKRMGTTSAALTSGVGNPPASEAFVGRIGYATTRIRAEPHEPSATSIRDALDAIDWYQFEKFCAALLTADGFNVERKGGAQPDGGVDLIVTKEGARALIQCKHWRTWVVQEKTVREMLGSMTHYSVRQGAIYTLKGWTEPTARFAAEHDITLVNGDELAASAAIQLSAVQLQSLLDSSVHHCPKCEASMVWREGKFPPFWGCSRYPRCRGKLNHAGAR